MALYTTAEAVRAVRAHKGGICLSVRLDAHIEGDESMVFPRGLSHYLRLSKAAALRLVSNMLSQTLESRGGRVKLDVRNGIMWIS